MGCARTSSTGEVFAAMLIVRGEHASIVPIAWAYEAHERIPDSDLRVFVECGPMPPRKPPQEFSKVVGSWISERR
jgi:pimeloyl-ACP methyl ester carboxylesterase